MAPDRSGKSVFLGNIPYNLTEEQVKDILSSAGTVTKFRLMINPETGKPKGYGFADFADADAAASAVRNLNDYEVMGRKIRVDWPHNNEKDSIPPDYSQQSQMGLPIPGQDGQGGQAPLLPSLPPGTDLPPNLTCPNAISQTLASLPAPQLLDVLTQMKSLVMADPSRATELLRQAPQLAYAIFQALLLMNLVDYSTLGSVVEQAAQTQQSVPQMPQPYQPYPSMPGQISTPPVHSTPFAPPPQTAQQQPPPQQQQQQQQQQPSQPQVPGQDELLQQVLTMPQATIDALPPAERSQIMLLRQQLLQGGMR